LNTQNHELITRSAIARLPAGFPLSEGQQDAVVMGNILSDANLGSSGVHCDNCAFAEGAARIRACRRAIESEPDRFGVRSLRAFGGLLHTVQDFYAHSNWIELHKGLSEMPLWDWDQSTLPGGILSGTILQEEPKRCSQGTPDHILVNKDSISSEQGKKVVSEGPNKGKTFFELAFEAAVEASILRVNELVLGVECFRITTRTGESLFSGTDAQVFIILHGREKDTGRILLDNPGIDDFERGRTDTFIVGTTAGIGDIERITIGFEAEEGLFPGWHLEEVVVEEASGRVDEDMSGRGAKRFRCGRWLARNKGDGKTVVELRPE